MADVVHTLTKEEFVNHLMNSGDFRHMKPYRVEEEVQLGRRLIKKPIYFGSGVFENGFSFGSGKIMESIQLNTTIFKKHLHFNQVCIHGENFFCDQAVVEEWCCDVAKFSCDVFCRGMRVNVFNGNDAHFFGLFCREKSEYEKFHCNNAEFHYVFKCGTVQNCDEDFSCDYAAFRHVLAEDNYPLAMVIYHYKTGRVHFSLNDFKRLLG